MVNILVKVFSACAVGSSMAGASVSLVDFFQDALSSSSSSAATGPAAAAAAADPAAAAAAATNSGTTNNNNTNTITNRKMRPVAAAIALVPPLGLACAYPQAFLGALENAGLIGGVSLYGLIPALAVLRLRRISSNSSSSSSKDRCIVVGGGGGCEDDDHEHGIDTITKVVQKNNNNDDDDDEDGIIIWNDDVMPGRLSGGSLTLYLIIGISTTLVLPEFVRLVENYLI